MTTAWVPLATTTLDSAAASVTFGSIPAIYRDLILVIRGKASADLNLGCYLNGDTGSNYPYVRMYGTGSSATSNSGTASRLDFDAGNATVESTWILQFMDYSVTDKHKTVLIRGNQDLVSAWVDRWANTAAINSIEAFAQSTTWAIGTSFSLYGSNRL